MQVQGEIAARVQDRVHVRGQGRQQPGDLCEGLRRNQRRRDRGRQRREQHGEAAGLLTSPRSPAAAAAGQWPGPARPAPEVTFQDRYTLDFAADWVPIYKLNLSEHAPGYIQASAIALSYPWTHFICGHLGRLATRDDVAVHQQYIADIQGSSREALATVDPTPFYMRHGENVWAGVKAHLDTVTERAPRPSSRSTPAAGRRGHREFHHHHDVRHLAVDSPRPRPRRAGPPLTRTTPGAGRRRPRGATGPDRARKAK